MTAVVLVIKLTVTFCGLDATSVKFAPHAYVHSQLFKFNSSQYYYVSVHISHLWTKCIHVSMSKLIPTLREHTLFF